MNYFKLKFRIYIWLFIGLPLLILLLVIGILTGQQSVCGNNKTQTNIDSGDMETNAKNIYKHWKRKYNATPQGSAGVLGALQLESKLDPKAVNTNSGAMGLCQWLGKRLFSLKKVAKKEHKSITNLGVQLDYLDKELKGPYKKYKSCLKEKNVHQATKDWTLGFEGLRKSPDQWYLKERQGYADHWYAVIGTNDPASKNTMENASDEEQVELGCNDDSNSNKEQDNDIVKVAKHFKGWFYYAQSHPSPDLGDLNNPNKKGGTDCSGFVWLVLNKAGYEVPPNMSWYTSTMAHDAQKNHQCLKQISKNQAKAGDIVIVNQGTGCSNNGHTAILLEKWHGKSTKIIQEGGREDRGSVNEDRFGTSFTNLLKNGNVVLARPIKRKE